MILFGKIHSTYYGLTMEKLMLITTCSHVGHGDKILEYLTEHEN
jgi:hypothetical protein